MPKICNKHVFSLTATKLGLEEISAELDTSVYILEEKPHPKLNVVVVHAAQPSATK